MIKAISSLTRKKRTRPFKEFYSDWFNTLKNNLLPLLSRSISGTSPMLLAARVDDVLQHFLHYYRALDLAASDDVSQIIYPHWRNPIEEPFLWLGDFHPYLFTNLLRSFLDENDDDGLGEATEHSGLGCAVRTCSDLEKPWQIAMAWKHPSETLTAGLEQIECGLRLMVPSLVNRARNAQAGFARSVAENWVASEEAEKAVVAEAIKAGMDEMACVFADANRLRRSVLSEIIGATSVYQAALFLEGLAQFIVGFRDSELVNAFERCETPLQSQSWPQL